MKPAFFTPEMGSRLREIRLKRAMTLDQVAAGMGRQGSGIRSYLARLERGKVSDPRISTITLYLRACGAQFFEFYDALTRIEPVLVDTRPIERLPMKREQKEMLLRRVKREVYNYQDETSYPKRGKPIAPEKQKPAAAKLAEYRVQVALIEQEVKKLLGTVNVTFVEIAGYLTIARRILGELRRAVRGRVRGHSASGDTIPNSKANSGHVPSGSCPQRKLGTVTDYVRRNRLNPELVERIRQLVIERYRR
jgi:transcriptional regulator with XRE-family HTH domain